MLPAYRIYQIEVSNLCSLSCSYCPWPTQVRPRGLMDESTFRKCLDAHLRVPQNRGETIYLHQFGEALLHPELEHFIGLGTSLGVLLSLTTNGVDESGEPFPTSRWQALAAAGLRHVHFSAHKLRPQAFRAVLSGTGIRISHVWEPTQGRHTWAGQTSLRQSKALGGGRYRVDEARTHTPCVFERRNMFSVLWDGSLAACCIDAEGQLRPQTIDDVLERGFRYQPVPLCEGCDLMR